MSKRFLFFVFLGSLVLASAAFAQSNQPSAAAQGAAPAAASGGAAGARGGRDSSTTYDFEDDLVTGDLVRPDIEVLQGRRRGRRSSLIRVREHFVPEMLKSVENL